MDVYLVPLGADRYELYCEVPDDDEPDADAEPRAGVFARMRARFREMLAEAERERRQGRPAGEDRDRLRDVGPGDRRRPPGRRQRESQPPGLPEAATG